MDYKKSLEDLVKSWKNSPEPSLKISSYFPIYADLFSKYRGKPCVFIETGVLYGGSLFMWKEWLGPQARIIGIDLNPGALKWQKHGFEIYIGDQGDPQFWRDFYQTIGNFDVLLDDGGHQSFQQIVTVQEAIRHAKNVCQIIVEDTATSFMKDFSSHGKYSFLEYAKAVSDCLLMQSSDLYLNRFDGQVNHTNLDFFSRVHSVQFFNQIVAFDLNPHKSMKGKRVTNQNTPEFLVEDYRSKGCSSALVNWPDLFSCREVLVKGQSS